MLDNLLMVLKEFGFPVACVAALFWYVVRSGEQHKEEMQAMSEALNNNTQALIRLEEKIGGLTR